MSCRKSWEVMKIQENRLKVLWPGPSPMTLQCNITYSISSYTKSLLHPGLDAPPIPLFVNFVINMMKFNCYISREESLQKNPKISFCLSICLFALCRPTIGPTDLKFGTHIKDLHISDVYEGQSYRAKVKVIKVKM